MPCSCSRKLFFLPFVSFHVIIVEKEVEKIYVFGTISSYSLKIILHHSLACLHSFLLFGFCIFLLNVSQILIFGATSWESFLVFTSRFYAASYFLLVSLQFLHISQLIWLLCSVSSFCLVLITFSVFVPSFLCSIHKISPPIHIFFPSVLYFPKFRSVCGLIVD